MTLEQKTVDKKGLQLQLSVDDEAFLEICLFDEIGHLVYNFCDYITPGYFNHQIPVKKLSGGIYLLRIAVNGDTTTHEIISL